MSLYVVALRGAVWLGLSGKARLGPAGLGVSTLGGVWQVCLGLVVRGSAWLGSVWHGTAGKVWRVVDW